jgi:hypothetical protein
MAFTNTQFEEYALHHYNEDHISKTGTICRIFCLKDNNAVGILYFYKDGVQIPPSRKNSSGQITLNFPAYQMSPIISTLRYEKPLYIRYDDESHHGFIMTLEEPIGVEEY